MLYSGTFLGSVIESCFASDDDDDGNNDDDDDDDTSNTTARKYDTGAFNEMQHVNSLDAMIIYRLLVTVTKSSPLTPLKH